MEEPETNDTIQDQEIDKQPVEENEDQLTDEQINWKKFREEKAKDRKRAEEAERRAAESAKQAEAMKEALMAVGFEGGSLSQGEKAQLDAKREEAIAAGLDPADYPTGAQVQSYVSNMMNKDFKNVVKQVLEEEKKAQSEQQAKRDAQELPMKIKQAHKDFDLVCSQENVDYMEYHYPEIMRSFTDRKQNFEMYDDLYRTMKKLVPNIDSSKDMGRAERNAMKPRSLSAEGSSVSGDETPMYLTEDKKAANWRRMQAIMRGA